MTEIEKALQLETETDIILRIGEIIWKKTEKGDDSFSNLTEPEKIFIYVDMLEGQVNNGGFDQFFFNSSGDYTHEILSAYEKIYAYKTADLIATAIKAFPVSPVSKDTEIRREIMRNLNESTTKVWDDLDDKFYEYEDNIAGLLIDYIKQNIKKVAQ
jgi:hypothetical protein